WLYPVRRQAKVDMWQLLLQTDFWPRLWNIGNQREIIRPWRHNERPYKLTVWIPVAHRMRRTGNPAQRLTDAQQCSTRGGANISQQAHLSIAWLIIKQRYIRQVLTVKSVHFCAEAVLTVSIGLLSTPAHTGSPSPDPVRHAIEL